MAKNTKILVAEDENPMAQALKTKLEKSGYDVDIATDGKDAIAKIDASDYDLYILDLMMPDVDGFGVLEHLKAKNSTAPTIVCTNLSQPEDEARALKLGAKECFVKSNISLQEIVEQVKKHIS